MSFRDRKDAGQQLAAKLGAYAGRTDVVVIALPRGGVPVADEVAKALRAPLDIVVVRRLPAPSNHDVTIGAVAGGGIRVIDESLVRALCLSDPLVEEMVKREEREIERRENIYHEHHQSFDLTGRTVILVDDGIATGASMHAAVAVIETRHPAAIVVAVPVASFATCAKLARRIRESVYCFIRDPVYSVSLWYESYPPISDDDACRILGQTGAARESHPAGLGDEHGRELGAGPTGIHEQG
jgi:putative phosphoribosyl transferase